MGLRLKTPFLLSLRLEGLEQLITLSAQYDLVLSKKFADLFSVIAPPGTFQFLHHDFDHVDVVLLDFTTVVPHSLGGRTRIRGKTPKRSARSERTLANTSGGKRYRHCRRVAGKLNEVRHDIHEALGGAANSLQASSGITPIISR